MVAKISHSNNLYGVLCYNQNKVDEKEASVLFSQDILFSQERKYNVEDCMKSFETFLLTNKKTKNPVVHISLNPDPRDVVDDETAKQIAQEYMTSLGYGNQPYLLYKHEDIERTHYHIVTLCVDELGNKINDKFEKRRSTQICRDIEKEFGLHIPTKRQLFEESLVKHLDYKKGDLSKQIRSITSQLLDTYKVTSMSEYRTLLELHGITLTEIKGKVGYIGIKGLVYSAINEEGGKVGKQIKSSFLGKSFGTREMEKKFKFNKKLITERNTDFIRKVTTQCMYQCKERSRQELTDLLQKRGIDLVLRTNEEGRTYGVTFIDHNTKTVINGSDLGDEFSANILNKFFDNPYYILTEELENKGIDTPTKERETRGLFIPIPSDYDPDEEAKKKRKKKKGFRY